MSDIENATIHLYTQTIPHFAKRVGMENPDTYTAENLVEVNTTGVTTHMLTAHAQDMHSFGLNLRHLGFLRRHLPQAGTHLPHYPLFLISPPAFYLSL